jgi:hypothetical protein
MAPGLPCVPNCASFPTRIGAGLLQGLHRVLYQEADAAVSDAIQYVDLNTNALTAHIQRDGSALGRLR